MVVDKMRRSAAPSNCLRTANRTREMDAAAEEILRLRMELAAQTQRVETLTRLAGTVSHDFNNVLMAISAGVTLAGRHITDPRALDRLDDVRDAVRTGASLASQMTCLLRSHHVTTLQRVQVDAVIRQMRCLLGGLAGKGVDLRLHLRALDASLETHPAYFQQILLNLVLNARDAMSGTGCITISTELFVRDGRPLLVLSVSDEGEGISPERRDEIFRPYISSKIDRGGTGLGLFIVRTLTEELSGEVEVRSELGQGTTFQVTLPCDQSLTEEDATPTTVFGERDRTTGRTILLVEDDRAVHAPVRALLEDDGHTVWSARCAGEAQKIIDSGAHIDVLLVEAILPDGTGCHLAASARERRPGLATVFMSAHPREDLVSRARIEEDVPFLQKPFSSEELLRRVVPPAAANSSRGHANHPTT